MGLEKWSHLKQYVQRSATTPGSFRNPANQMVGLYTLFRLPNFVEYQPEQVKIETTTRCNLACRFCGHTWGAARNLGIEHLPEGENFDKEFLRACARSGKHLSREDFQRIADQFPCMTRLDIQGMGEPLLNPNFSDILDFGRKRDVEIQFFTNATLLTLELARKIVTSHVSEISISLDGTTAGTYEMIRPGAVFQKVVDNIHTLCEVKKQKKAEKPIVRIAMVVTSFNMHQLPHLVELASQLGADQVVATQFKCISPDLASWTCDPIELAAGIEEGRKKAHELSIPLRIEFAINPSNHQSQNITGKAKAIKHSQRKKASCFWPWFSVNINIDGYLTPCAYVPLHEGWNLGNVLDRPFKDLWNAEPYQKLRQCIREGNMSGIYCMNCLDR
jgi:MoaA/NifB/PqqE/SkfB family radical SAM enzyme